MKNFKPEDNIVATKTEEEKIRYRVRHQYDSYDECANDCLEKFKRNIFGRGLCKSRCRIGYPLS